jgi:hypothetical protein
MRDYFFFFSSPRYYVAVVLLFFSFLTVKLGREFDSIRPSAYDNKMEKLIPLLRGSVKCTRGKKEGKLEIERRGGGNISHLRSGTG